MPKSSASKASPANWLRLEHQLCYTLYSSSLAMTKRYKPLLAPLGLTYPQYLVMLVLWEGDGVTVSAIGERLLLDSGTLTPLLKRLEALGFVQRLRDSADERRVLLRLTPAGRQLKALAARIPPEIALATGCKLDDLTDLMARLKQLRARLLSTADPDPDASLDHPTAA
jgi:DNA-binding MarR family transcriptional regulator